jgi:hypothetical protein
MKTALLVIATGKYNQYIDSLIHSAEKNLLFNCDVILWTDSVLEYPVYKQIYTSPKGFPNETLFRYHTFLEQQALLSKYDCLLYSDVDMLFVDLVSDGIFTYGITATEHPGYLNLTGTPERRPESTAYCPNVRTYFCGGFNGGSAEAFLTMSETIRKNINEDERNGIKAVWNDESHLNKYLYDNPPAIVLDPGFCFPESEYRNPGGYYSAIWRSAGRENIKPRLLALDKK